MAECSHEKRTELENERERTLKEKKHTHFSFLFYNRYVLRTLKKKLVMDCFDSTLIVTKIHSSLSSCECNWGGFENLEHYFTDDAQLIIINHLKSCYFKLYLNFHSNYLPYTHRTMYNFKWQYRVICFNLHCRLSSILHLWMYKYALYAHLGNNHDQYVFSTSWD